MNFNDLNDQEQHQTLTAMRRFGGGFVAALADAWQRADSFNSARLALAFPDIVQRYGPGTQAFSDCAS